MEMQVLIWGLGASLKPINMGFNLFTGAYLNFRPNSSSPITDTIGIADSLNIGGKKGTLVYGQVKTDFFPVSLELHPWIANLKDLIGKELDISVSGSLLIDGSVSVKLIHIGKEYEKLSVKR